MIHFIRICTFLFDSSYLLALVLQLQSGETRPVDCMLNMISVLICLGYLFSFNFFLLNSYYYFILFSIIAVLVSWTWLSNCFGLTFVIFVEGLFVMPVFMLIWEELLVEGMILNLLPTHSFSFIKAGYLGKVIRYIHCEISVVLAIYFIPIISIYNIEETFISFLQF